MSKIVTRTLADFSFGRAKFSLEDVAIRSEILQQIIPAVEYLINPKRFDSQDIEPKGILFTGPPGSGKSILAEAIAGHAGVGFCFISCPALADKYVGETEKNLRTLFAEATKNSPCVVLLDEFDSIAGKRHAGGGYRNDVVNQLLTLLAEKRPGVLITATTNSYNLDPAVIRSGRFDRTITIDLPNAEERQKILEIHTRKRPLHNKVCLTELAHFIDGFSGAKIASWVKEAHMQAVLKGRKNITFDDFMRTAVIAFENTAPQIQQDESIRFDTAIHEAGHALVAHKLGLTPYYISVMQSSSGLGVTRMPYKHITRNEDVFDQICIALGGVAAESIYNRQSVGLKSDLESARSMAQLMLDSSHLAFAKDPKANKIHLILKQQRNRATQILRSNREELDNLATNLANYNYLFRQDVLELLAGKEITLKYRKSQEPLKIPKKVGYPKVTTRPTNGFFANQNKNITTQYTQPEKPLFHFLKKQIAFILNTSPRLIVPIISDSGHLFIIFSASISSKLHTILIPELDSLDIKYSIEINGDEKSRGLIIRPDSVSDFLNMLENFDDGFTPGFRI